MDFALVLSLMNLVTDWGADTSVCFGLFFIISISKPLSGLSQQLNSYGFMPLQRPRQFRRRFENLAGKRRKRRAPVRNSHGPRVHIDRTVFDRDRMKWNPQDYARNSSAQLSWARELISRMAFSGVEAVLDVGCGDGKITAEFARALPGGYVLGVDSSPEFIAYASRHYPKALFSSLQFEVMDARSLNINNRFDLVFSNAAMHWVDDHSAFLRGVAKHLRVGGRLVL